MGFITSINFQSIKKKYQNKFTVKLSVFGLIQCFSEYIFKDKIQFVILSYISLKLFLKAPINVYKYLHPIANLNLFSGKLAPLLQTCDKIKVNLHP